MNRVSSESLAYERRLAAPKPIATRRVLIWTAWIATLLLSKLPLVIARDLLGGDIPWINQAWIGAAVLLFAATYVWRSLAPLRNFFAVMAAIFLATTVFDPWLSGSVVWGYLFAEANPLVALFSERVVIAMSAVIVVAALIAMGYKRREIFLTTGELNAPVEGLRLPGRAKPVTWLVFGAAMTLLLSLLFFNFMASQSPVSLPVFAAALPWLPLALVSAGLNAFGEEAMYRAGPLATLLPAVGPKHALWMTSIWFGLGHYYGGSPSGMIGFVFTGLLGLLLGKAMLDTRGMGWSWIIHVAMDTVIYIFMAMSFVYNG